MSDTGHVHTDLVGTTCFKTTFHIRGLAKTFQHFVMCYCIFTIFMIDGHFFTICRMPSNRSLYGSLILFQISLHNCPVASADTVTFQLFCQIPVSNIIFAYQQCPGGILINSVDNSRPHHSVNTGKAVTTMCHNCIDQCSLIMPGCRMYNHPFGLINDQYIFILVKNIQRNILRNDIQLTGIRDLQMDPVIFTDLIIRFGSLLSHGNLSFFQKFLKERPGKTAVFLSKIAVDSYT